MSIETLNNSNSLQKSLQELKNQIKSGAYGKETLNPIHEMSLKEIMELGVNELKKIYSNIKESEVYDDKNGTYVIINKKKFYYTLGNPLNNGRTYIDIDPEDKSISIGKKEGNKIKGVYLKQLNDDNELKDEYYKGILKYEKGALIPDKTNQDSTSKKTTKRNF